MAKIQIADLHNVNTESLLIKLTNSEQNEINGGGLLTLAKAVGTATWEFIKDVLD